MNQLTRATIQERADWPEEKLLVGPTRKPDEGTSYKIISPPPNGSYFIVTGLFQE